MKKIQMLFVVIATLMVGFATPASAYQVGEYVGFERLVTFHFEVRYICSNPELRALDLYNWKVRAEVSKRAKSGEFKMPRGLSSLIFIAGFDEKADIGKKSFEVLDRGNLFIKSIEASRFDATSVTFNDVTAPDPAFAIRTPFAFKEGAVNVAVTPGNWKLANGSGALHQDFAQRVKESRTADLVILLVDPKSTSACD